MKKLIVALVALTIGISANAASYYWGVQSFDYLGPDGSGYDADLGMNNYTGATALLYLGTVTYNDGFVTDGTTFIASAGYDDAMMGYGVLDNSDLSALPTSSDIAAAGGQAYSIVLVDATGVTSLDDSAIGNYIILTGTSDSYYDPGTEITAANLVDFSSVIGGDGVAWSPVSSGPDPIPEPTSGLLMLVGLAGLALRRKQA